MFRVGYEIEHNRTGNNSAGRNVLLSSSWYRFHESSGAFISYEQVGTRNPPVALQWRGSRQDWFLISSGFLSRVLCCNGEAVCMKCTCRGAEMEAHNLICFLYRVLRFRCNPPNLSILCLETQSPICSIPSTLSASSKSSRVYCQKTYRVVGCQQPKNTRGASRIVSGCRHHSDIVPHGVTTCRQRCLRVLLCAVIVPEGVTMCLYRAWGCDYVIVPGGVTMCCHRA